MLDDIANRNRPPAKRKNIDDDFSDWPDKDVNKQFRRLPKTSRTKLVQGFDAGHENENRREKGVFQINNVDIYPDVKPMNLTRIGDKHSLYTTGNVEYDPVSGIHSPIIRGDTPDMRTPNLEGTDFDNVKPAGKYGKPYVPLTQEEKDNLINNVRDHKYEYNTKLDLLFAKNNTEQGNMGFRGNLVRANRPVPVLSGDDFDNIQSAGKSQKRSARRRQTKRKHKHKRKCTHKKRSNGKTKKHGRHNKRRSLRTRRKRGGVNPPSQRQSSSSNNHDLRQLFSPRPQPTVVDRGIFQPDPITHNDIHDLNQYIAHNGPLPRPRLVRSNNSRPRASNE